MLKVYFKELRRFFQNTYEYGFSNALETYRNMILAEKIKRLHIHSSVIYAVLNKIDYKEALFYVEECNK